ncbi:MAG: insulinase family protein [Chloroflexota bacterium]|nr:MAG: insulinase family protein [Chloroflexota bacterium]
MPDTTYPGPESIHRHVLDNGITVLLYQNETAESLVVEGLVRAGGIVDGPEKAGLASFTADMLMRGTEQRTFEAIYEEIESVGASLHFGAGRHISDFSGVALVEDADLLFSLIAGSLRQPTFPHENIERARGEIMTGLQIRANDTRRMAALAFRRLLYGDHPYGRSVTGYPETIENIGRDDLVDYYHRYYGPGGMIITVVGGLEPADALTKVESAFGDWRTDQAEMPDAPKTERPTDVIRTDVDMPQKTQSDIVLGLPGPLRAAEDYLEASMANTILGVFGMMGRLGKKVREEQGLAYYVFSRLRGGIGPSPWYVSTGVAPDKVESAIDSILREIDRLRNEPLPAEDLADSQAYRTGSLPVGLETNSALAGTITDMEFHQLGLDYLQLLPDKIRAMTPASVQAAAAKYLSTESLAIAVAGPGDGA